MGKIIAVANQKGGVAKTTTCINLGASLVATKRRVLVVDLDPQGNATVGSGVSKDELQYSSYHVLLGKAPATEVIIHSESGGYDILPTNGDLTAAEVELMNMMVAREQRLRQALETVRDKYDFILIDCPPSLNMLTLNAMVAADSVMIPMQCEYYALEGLSALLNTIEEIRASVNPRLEVEGLLRTMYDPRSNLSSDVSGQLILHFGDKVYRTVIPRNVRLAEAPSHGLPALKYDRSSRGAVAYLALAGEILRRSGQPQVQQAAI
ncbi:MAG: ParA family protein [Chromatiales bacterium]|nr:ParA family protein [Gammaproteobacteria bacterium]MBW6477602.1 ParA family protein [Chromatiales bacterium]